MSMKRTLGMKIFNVFNIAFLLLAAALCVLPFIHVLAISLSNTAAVQANMVGLWPVNFTTYAYRYVLERPNFWTSLLVSFARVFVGLLVNMSLIMLTAYPLSKTNEQMPHRTIFVWYFFLTILFSGGIIPLYMLIRQLKLLDSLWSLVLPTALPVFNMILMLNFYRQTPKEMEEAALIDGASQWRIMLQIYIPVSKPAIATLALYTIVGHWNSWFDGMVYMNRPEHYPVQTYLRTVLMATDMTAMTTEEWKRMSEISNRTIKCAQIFISAIPVLLVYPFLQKYFVTGIVLGSVKG